MIIEKSLTIILVFFTFKGPVLNLIGCIWAVCSLQNYSVFGRAVNFFIVSHTKFSNSSNTEYRRIAAMQIHRSSKFFIHYWPQWPAKQNQRKFLILIFLSQMASEASSNRVKNKSKVQLFCLITTIGSVFIRKPFTAKPPTICGLRFLILGGLVNFKHLLDIAFLKYWLANSYK